MATNSLKLVKLETYIKKQWGYKNLQVYIDFYESKNASV
jgi:hypothetical protein